MLPRNGRRASQSEQVLLLPASVYQLAKLTGCLPGKRLADRLAEEAVHQQFPLL